VNEARAALIDLSTAHGILCSQTAFVGVAEPVYRPLIDDALAKRLAEPMQMASEMQMVEQLHSQEYRMERYYECCTSWLDCPRAEVRKNVFFSSLFSALARPFRRNEDSAVQRAPPRPPPAATAPSPTSAEVPLMRIVELQNISGSWPDADAVILLSGRTPVAFDSVRAQCGDAFATVLVVALLRHRCAERETSWRVAEQKALAWLRNEFGNAGAVEALIAQAIALLFSSLLFSSLLFSSLLFSSLL
jgi:hypothetical protein